MPVTVGSDTSKTRRTLSTGGKSVAYYSIPAAEAAGLGTFSNLPAALKVVLENMLRFEDGKTVTVDDIKAFSEWGANGGRNPREIALMSSTVAVLTIPRVASRSRHIPTRSNKVLSPDFRKAPVMRHAG